MGEGAAPMVNIFTDGSLRTQYSDEVKEYYGGFASVLVRHDGHCLIIGQGARNTTINRMELIAILAGLQALKVRCGVTVYSDSRYSVNALSRWIYGWMTNGWKTYDGTDVANRDLLEQLHAFQTQHISLDYRWVRSHNGARFNEIADKVAKTCRERIELGHSHCLRYEGSVDDIESMAVKSSWPSDCFV